MKYFFSSIKVGDRPSKQNPRPEKSETQFINRVVSLILASGMYTTVVFYLIGLILFFVKGDSVPEVSKQYYGSFDSFVSSALSLQPRAFLFLGTITLILTPVSRVLISIFAFWKEKDKKFVVVTAIVFIVILSSMIFGMIFKINVA